MSKTNAFETDWLELLFLDTNIADIGDAAGLRGDGSVPGSLWVALYTSSPTETGDGTECNYGSYARVAVARSGAGWTVTDNEVENAATVTFPSCTSGNNTANAVAICSQFTGQECILYYGTLATPLSISTGVQPAFAAGELVVNET